MKKTIHALAVACVCSFSLNLAMAQQPQAPTRQSSAAVAAEPEAPRVVLQAETTASVLRLMKFSGLLRDRAGNPRTGAVGLTFSLYKDQQGGSPLWLEVHNAQLDEQGRYAVLLGSTKSEGLPLELFSSGEARWMGVQLNLPGEEEQPRVLLVSVPYALKAADAETLGGKPPSAFVLAQKPENREAGAAQAEASKEAVKEGPQREAVVGTITGEGTTNMAAKFTGANTIGNGIIFDDGNNVGFGTTVPAFKVHVQETAANPEIRNTVVGDGFPWITVQRTGGVTKTNRAWSMVIGDQGQLLFQERGIANRLELSTTGSLLTGGFVGAVPNPPVNSFLVSGNVGIGTTNPFTAKLEVVGGTGATGLTPALLVSNQDLILKLRDSRGANTSSFIQWENDNGGAQWRLGTEVSSGPKFVLFNQQTMSNLISVTPSAVDIGTFLSVKGQIRSNHNPVNGLPGGLIVTTTNQEWHLEPDGTDFKIVRFAFGNMRTPFRVKRQYP